MNHQQTSSVFPIDYLSPASKKARLSNLKIENRTLKAKITKLQALKVSNLSLCDNQSQEMTQLVRAISSSEFGRSELQKIFDEAETHGEDKGFMLRNVWDDTENSIFFRDQFSNGILLTKFSVIHVPLFLL